MKFVYDIVSICVKLLVSIRSSFFSFLFSIMLSILHSLLRCFGSSVVLMGGLWWKIVMERTGLGFAWAGVGILVLIPVLSNPSGTAVILGR